MECTTLPRLTKSISRTLEHSGKCRSVIDPLASKRGCACRGLPTNQRSILVQRRIYCRVICTCLQLVGLLRGLLSFSQGFISVVFATQNIQGLYFLE
ncbi:unnamed protein product [Hymenolepis diminuta]|uniref:Uncharacterized protein n=1 Tax=Hymenolepis diminuta TaxID=6216 RepID=A0A564ZBP7_HYMDI|nr:unnamed protein product [Hymenolepis diminuta]